MFYSLLAIRKHTLKRVATPHCTPSTQYPTYALALRAGSVNYCRKTSVYALCREKANSTCLYLEHERD